MSEVKERPDSPGVWFCEGDNRAWHVWDAGGSLRISTIMSAHWCDIHACNAGRWLKADLTPPEFPKLPEKPKLVLAKAHCPDIDRQFWWSPGSFKNFYAVGDSYLRHASELEVIPHPDNDPEAVAAIERAKQS